MEIFDIPEVQSPMEISGLRSRNINSYNSPFKLLKQFKTEIISP
jgi:hypothetical protein